MVSVWSHMLLKITALPSDSYPNTCSTRRFWSWRASPDLSCWAVWDLQAHEDLVWSKHSKAVYINSIHMTVNLWTGQPWPILSLTATSKSRRKTSPRCNNSGAKSICILKLNAGSLSQGIFRGCTLDKQQTRTQEDISSEILHRI